MHTIANHSEKTPFHQYLWHTYAPHNSKIFFKVLFPQEYVELKSELNAAYAREALIYTKKRLSMELLIIEISTVPYLLLNMPNVTSKCKMQ